MTLKLGDQANKVFKFCVNSMRLYISFIVTAFNPVQAISLQQRDSIKTNTNLHDQADFHTESYEAVLEFIIITLNSVQILRSQQRQKPRHP